MAIRYTYLMARQAAFLEVEVDTNTGMVDLVKSCAVNDVGYCHKCRGGLKPSSTAAL